MTRAARRRLLTVAVCSLAAALNSGCVHVSEIREHLSPDGRYILTIFTVEAGAMGGFTTVATLRKKGEEFSRIDGEVFAIRGEHTVEVSWVADRSVALSCSDCDPGRVERRLDHWRDVSLTYRFADR
jgi:hypothetical protein